MVKEAEEFAEQDKAQRQAIDAKNHLEGYAFSMRTTIQDKLQGKITDEDKETLEAAITETLQWMDDNPDADKEMFDSKKLELEEIYNPIITKIYQESGGTPDGDDNQEQTEEPLDHDEL